jgi:hypothetical protein
MTGYKTRVDRSYTITFTTQELDPTTAAELSQCLQVYGTLGFSFSDEALEVIDTLEAPDEILETSKKTQAERIRASLYRLWEYNGKHGDFETYYRQKTEDFIRAIQAKLPDRNV